MLYTRKFLIETIPVNTGFPIPGSGGGWTSSRSTTVPRAADKFRVVADLRMEVRWMDDEEGIVN